MNLLDFSTNQKYSNKKPITNMSCWMRNQRSNLYNSVSIRDTLAGRLESMRGIAFILYERMMGNIEYGRERLNGIADKEAREEEQENFETR